MCETIDFEGLASPKAIAMLRLASIVIADDGDSEATLYSEPVAGGRLLTVFLHPGDVMFEQPNFHNLCQKVAKLKGSCQFQIAEGKPVKHPFSGKVEPTNRIKDSLPSSTFFQDDDDDSASWWKRGDA